MVTDIHEWVLKVIENEFPCFPDEGFRVIEQIPGAFQRLPDPWSTGAPEGVLTVFEKCSRPAVTVISPSWK